MTMTDWHKKNDACVAILLATYNGEKYLAQQLDSILAQEWKNFRCFVHDDGSTDGTLRVIDEYRVRDPERIVLCDYGPSGGAKQNFFSLMGAVEADYYAFCDQDDVWKPDKLALAMASFVGIDPVRDVALVYSDASIADDSLNVIHKSFLECNGIDPSRVDFRLALLRGVAPGCTMVFSRALRDACLQCDDLDHLFMHDWWVMLVAFGAGGQVTCVDRPTMLYRQHGDNTVGYHRKGVVSALVHCLHGFRRNLREKYVWARRPYGFAVEARHNDLITLENRRLCDKLCQVVEQGNKIARVRFYAQNFRGTDNLLYRLMFV